MTALVVEDDKAIQQLLRDALEAEGFQVTAEKDGEWALMQLERRLPDLVITDVLLPSVSGFELIAALRAMPGGTDVPVIVISGIYRGRRHKKTAEESLGVVGYLDKPFEVGALISVIKRTLGDQYPGVERSRTRKSPDAKRTMGDDPLAAVESKKERDDVEAAARALESTSRAARGNLKHKRFPEVLGQLYRWRATGALLLRRDRVKKIVYLREGYPIFVKSNLMSECLGRVLVREKMISEEECEKSITLMKSQTGRQQGTVLIEMAVISPHNLVYGLQLQLEEKLFDIFGWIDGDYQFSPKIDIPPQAVHLDMSLATIIYEGVRRRFSPRMLHDLLEPFADSYLAVHDDPLHRFQEISLEADERALVALIDGRRTLNEIIERSKLPREVASQLIYALFAAEMIQPVNKRARRRDSLLPTPAELSQESPPPMKRRARASDATARAKSNDPVLVPAALDALSADELRKRLATRIKALRRASLFEALGVSKKASADEIRRAFFALVRDVHPDNFRAHPADVRDLAAQIHNELVRAYETLSDDERRAEYESRLDSGSRTGVSDEVGRILAAENRFSAGEQALLRGDFDDAIEAFGEAANLYDDEGEFHAYLGFALFARESARHEKRGARDSMDKTILDESERHMREGIARSPRAESGYLFLGRLLKATGRAKDAVPQFELALQANPDCKEALQELRLLGRES
jgi:DNA-binding response OmpR family regulator/curved DNA-binding protein CbpA